MNSSSPIDRKTQILDAAEKRFARFGLSKVTMEEIAGDLGMSKAALYYYFKTKEEIFREVIAREQAQFIAGAEKILSRDAAAREKLVDYGRQRLSFFHEIANLNLLGIQAWLDVKPFMGDLFKEFARQEIHVLVRILKQGKGSGEFAAVHVEKTAGIVLNVLRGWGHHAFKSALSGEMPALSKLREENDQLMTILLNGLLTR
jgi:TetR/AcrR family transcriptional regulator